VLVVSDTIRGLIMQKSPAHLIREQAVLEGMTPLLEDGLLKAFAGITTIEEVIDVLYA
jgi:type II secretory ATPase GspE/PulE/Tfp pilus assembly ATPase PilB-like protein